MRAKIGEESNALFPSKSHKEGHFLVWHLRELKHQFFKYPPVLNVKTYLHQKYLVVLSRLRFIPLSVHTAQLHKRVVISAFGDRPVLK